jgi:hypothetical protein
MTRIILVFSIVMSALLFCGIVSGNYALAKPYVDSAMFIKEKKKLADNAKQLAEETRKKILEKAKQELKLKKDNSKKQIALEAMKKPKK